MRRADAAPDVTTYGLFGLRLESALEFPELPARSGERARDVHLSIRAHGLDADDPWSEAIARLRGERVGDDWFGADGDVAWFDWPNVARVRIDGGHSIEIAPCAGVDPAGLRAALLGPVFSVLLTQRGLYPLHASGVELNGAAIAFAAVSGTGKSTLALALHERGHAFLSDDVMAIDVEADPLRTVPAYPQIKMTAELIAHRGDDGNAMPLVNPEEDKRARAVAGPLRTEPLPLARVYLIEDGEPELIGPLPTKEALLAAIGHGHRAKLQHRTVGSDEVMRRARVIADGVPFFRLRRPRGLERLEELVERIEAHAQGR